MAKPKAPKKPLRTGERDDRYAAIVRQWAEWTPTKLRAAKRLAETGDLSQAVGLCELLLSDERVVSGLDARIEALLGLVPTFEPSGDRRRSNRAVKALEAEEDWWTAYPEAELRQLLKWGLLLGVSPARHAWTEREDHGGRLLPMLRFWHPQSLRWSWQDKRWTIRDTDQVEHVLTPGDGEWVLHTPFGSTRPWGDGLWYSLALIALVKYYAEIDSGRFGKRLSMIWGKSPEDSNKDQRRQLAEALIDSGDDVVAILAAGYELHTLPFGTAPAAFFENQVKAANEAITIRIRGGNLTSKVDGGSRAAAETQQSANEQPKLRFDAEALSTTLHDQSLGPWAAFNYGDSALAPWPVWPVEPEEDLKASADTINTLADGAKKLEDLGFELDDTGIVERFRLEGIVTGRKSPEVRAQEAAERAAQQQPAAAQPAKDPKSPKAPKAKAQGLVARLASGAPLSDSPGMLPGQMYADDVAESATAAGLAALKPTTAAIAAVLDEADSFEDVKTRLRAMFPSMSSEDLAELVYRAMLLGELAGRHAVNQDT